MSKINWTISEESLYDWRKAEELAKAIKASGDVAPEDDVRIRNLAHYLMTTQTVTWTGAAKKGLQKLADFLTRWQDYEPKALWEFYLKEIPTPLIGEWHDAYVESQSLFEPDPAQLPLAALTPEQRIEAETPGSPLTLPEPSLRKK